MLRKTVASIAIFAAMPGIGAVSLANAADRNLCFREEKVVLGDICYNPAPRGNVEFDGTQNGAGQQGGQFGVLGGHGGKFPGAHDGNLDGPQGGPQPG